MPFSLSVRSPLADPTSLCYSRSISRLRALVVAIVLRFELREDPDIKVGRTNQLTTRPFVCEKEEDDKDYPSSSLPLLFRRVVKLS